MAEKAYKTHFAQGLAWVLLLGAGLYLAPYVVGYGIALGGYVPYGVVCNTKDDLFSGKIDLDDYATFLMNRGCKYDEEIKRLLADYKNVDAQYVSDLVRNPNLRGRSADEIMVTDAVKATARKFKAPLGGGCGPASDADYCGLAGNFNDDLVSRAFRSLGDAYLGFFLPRMSDSIFEGAAALVDVSRKGPVFGAALFVAYALALLILSTLATKAVAWIAKDLLRSM
ncbi:hypothetical protein ACNHKD_10565 [Methylocystis sp. JAN1]|uniref:hypothetical protein n=1 Tax=Methylocystis sp. JAN1 TaxID=3397211 RepID=UPI003FA1B535